LITRRSGFGWIGGVGLVSVMRNFHLVFYVICHIIISMLIIVMELLNLQVVCF
jgi:hypothetical protein